MSAAAAAAAGAAAGAAAMAALSVTPPDSPVAEQRERDCCEAQHVLDLATRLNQAADLRTASKEILDKAVEAVAAERATLFLVNDAGPVSELSVCLSRGKDQPAHKEQMRKLSVPVDDSSVAGSVAKSGSSVVVADAYDDKRFNREVDAQTGFRTKSIVCVPLTGSGGTVVGVLQAVNRRDGSCFSQADCLSLERFAAVGGALVQRLRLVLALQEAQRRAEEMLVLMRDIPAEAAREGTSGVVRAIIRTAYRMLECERVTLLLEDPVTKNLVIQESKDAVGVVVPRGKGLAGFAAAAGRLINIADAHDDERFDPATDRRTHFRTGSVLAAPIRCEGGAVVGVLMAINRLFDGSDLATFTARSTTSHASASDRPPAGTHLPFFRFTPADERVMEALVGQAGVELSRAAAAKELQRSRDVTASLLDVVHASASEPSLHGMVRRVLAATYRLLGADRVSLFLVDAVREDLVLMNSEDARGVRLRFGEGIAGTVAKTGRLSNVPDAYSSPLFDSSVDRNTGFRTGAVLTVPISLPGPAVPSPRGPGSSSAAPIAVLQAIRSGAGRPFDRQDEDAVCAFAVEVALALKRRSVETVLMGILDERRHRSDKAERRSKGRGVANGAAAGAGAAAAAPTASGTSARGAGGAQPRGALSSGLGSARLQGEGPVPETDSETDADSPKAAGPPPSAEQSPRAERARRSTVATSTPGRAARLSSDSRVRRLSSAEMRVAAERMRARERRAAVSLLTYYDDSHASSRIHASVVLRRVQISARRPPSWPEGLVATADTSELGARDPLLTWGWDIFALWDGGSRGGEAALMTAVANMLRQFALLRRFHVKESTLQAFVAEVRSKYHANPFHNWLHAVAVMQASFLILVHTRAAGMLSYVDIFACLVAALCHDIDHPGTSNGFLIATEAKLALLHNDDAPLERHHSATAAALLQQKELDVFASLDAPSRKRVRKVMVGAILATDMSKHMGHIQSLADRAARVAARAQAAAEEVGADLLDGRLTASSGGASAVSPTVSPLQRSSSLEPPALSRALTSTSSDNSLRAARNQLATLGRRASAAGSSAPMLRSVALALAPFDRDSPADRLALVESVVHTADLSGQAFPIPIALKWGRGIVEEFQHEARLFEAHGLDPPPFITNLDTEAEQASLQTGFIGAMVLPLWERMQDVLLQLGEPLRNLRGNLNYNEGVAGRAAADEVAADSVDDDGDGDDDNDVALGSGGGGAGGDGDVHSEEDCECDAEAVRRAASQGASTDGDGSLEGADLEVHPGVA
ncbi:hypothetical protein FNF27_01942 [Cafeteria roenbergensis]|uniref:Phosphodiesterase n=1 Tax=Cafeteria roenbergensis TaxID=33653 RepID=A0A5A8ELK8_CAFRO|nr:hypothetical protein FNF27_01942 [Cafeteria roenbergensis]